VSLQTRLQDLITAIGADISGLQAALSGKANTSHTHSTSDISGLGSPPTGVSAALSTTQANSTVTPAVLTGHTFVVGPGKTLNLQGALIFRSAALTTGAAYGVRVAQGAGANGTATASWVAEVAVAAGSVATGVRNGGVINVAGGANAYGEVVGTGVSATTADHSGQIQAIVKNNSTNVNATVTIEFRSEVAASAVTAQLGTNAAGAIF
jgi:hypothetical protein